ncbi:uncharacterized protein I303_104003 [Kwoniella dejecticola CBS 10117]|uniref:Mitochondrial DNA polymerase catalytic subunit n=1 Tax=Kwoniella dejecticola CBS 10117 TaxID=1296121 RepID=A0A1A6A8B5_9TREE|nr:DNA polymerase gamma 1 [Kwoniella dejecticola CBS 10117]OBR86297.1 DNA polymerase gamma 1 [Kwoniella dejecticola CBS 10117]
MRRAFDVSRLTRPAQIRCRPDLCTINRSISQSSCTRKPANAARRVDVEDDLELDYGSYGGTRRADYEDYKEALAEQRKIKRSSPQGLRKSNLPSLSNAASFGRLEQDSKASSNPPEASTSTSTAKAKANSAEDVKVVTPPTRKGKEKAIDQTDLRDEYPDAFHEEAPSALRRNPVGVQMLSPSLHSQLFPGKPLAKPPRDLLDISLNHLSANNLYPDGAAVLPEINFDMPPLQGTNIRDHFYNLGHQTAEPYLSLAKEFMRSTLPKMPTKWELSRSGWTKYHADGRMEPVDDLGEESLVSFDVETLYKLSPFPVMATAVTPNAWYSWLSPTIFEEPPATPHPEPEAWDTSAPLHHPHELIPLFKGSKPRIVIGHNVGYDRARVKEEYDLERTSTRWIDTLSLHVATRGITSVQRPAWMAHRKNKKAKMLREQESQDAFREIAEENNDLEFLQGLQDWGGDEASDAEGASAKKWEDVTSVNSLAEVAFLHCGIPVDKSIRNRFADESIKHASQLRNELHELLTYCAGDVHITHKVYEKVLPLFLDSCPHPASFSGVLSMGNSFLPVDQHWEEYLKNAESTYKEMDQGVKRALRVLAEKTRKEGMKEGDPWIEQLDWSPKTARWADAPESDGTGVQEEDASSVAASTTDTSIDIKTPPATEVKTLPKWLSDLRKDPSYIISAHTQRYLLPLFLRLSYKGHPVAYLADHHWCLLVPHASSSEYIDSHGEPVELKPKKDKLLEPLEEHYSFFRIGKDVKKTKLVGSGIRSMLRKGELTSAYPELLAKVTQTDLTGVQKKLWECAKDLEKLGKDDIWAQQLDWTPVPEERPRSEATTSPSSDTSPAPPPSPKTKKAKSTKPNLGTWPKWYWDLTGPPSRIPAGELDLTFKKTVAPLLLRLQWQGYPLVHSRTHRWLYRVPRSIVESATADFVESRGGRVKFEKGGPDALFAEDKENYYFKLPHKDGEGKNVGNPLSKNFVKSIESGELASEAAESGKDDVAAKAAADATNMNAFCSYWISSRERIMDQMVVYNTPEKTQGMILPQVITMGTVTRRAVEGTWLTASNAKKNRVGSELKAMVRAPPGYAIVGADVDSEELWISSVMGDSQFGIHGSTAIGWMTLEGTKSAGTDLHSKTASILGISRDAAKVFNYSRIYGAGKKHAVQLLLQGDSSLTKESAGKLADNLYKATKGSKSLRNKNLPPASVPSIWHGGSESYLFNTLESIALSERPTTPALGCGITKALRKSYLEGGTTSYLPSRVNWVVQSSGVDYLHLLIVSMEYLIKTYNIKARYLISVHDEVRYLSAEEDKYRLALALQIANAWTRALFCYNLGMDDMPQGISFFSAVDIDKVLRKEVFLTCQTPSHPHIIPPGESLDILELLKKTNNGKDLGEPLPNVKDRNDIPISLIAKQGTPPKSLFGDISSADHRLFLQAQAKRKGDDAKRWLDGLPPVDQDEQI